MLQHLSCGQLEEEVKLRIQTQRIGLHVNEESLHLKLFGLKSAIFFGAELQAFQWPNYVFSGFKQKKLVLSRANQQPYP